MTSIEIDSIKEFMSHLFIKDTFDSFLCSEITITTFSTFFIDGTVVRDFLTEEEAAELADCKYIPWSRLKPYCFNIIKGTRTPLALKCIFALPDSAVATFAQDSGLDSIKASISGLFINVRYEKGRLCIITGTSTGTFTMDRSLDAAWDNTVKEFLKKVSM